MNSQQSSAAEALDRRGPIEPAGAQRHGLASASAVGVTLPAAEPADSLYQEDYRHYMRLESGEGHHMMEMGGKPMSMPMKMGAHEHPAHARH